MQFRYLGSSPCLFDLPGRGDVFGAVANSLAKFTSLANPRSFLIELWKRAMSSANGNNARTSDGFSSLERDHHYRSIFDSDMLGIIFGKIDSGEAVEVNDHYLKLIGYSRAEFFAKGLNWRDVTPSEYYPVVERAIQQTRERGISDPYERPTIRKDGSVFWAAVRMATVGEGLVIAYAMDITDRKQIQERLRESEEKFRAIFTHSSVGMAIVDDDGRPLDVNQKLEQIMGYSKHELQQRTFGEMTFPEDLPRTTKEMQEFNIFPVGTSHRMEKALRAQRRTGHLGGN